jgi:hypothetical protein
MSYTKGPWKLMYGTVPDFDGSDVLTVYGPNAKINEKHEIIAAIVDKTHCVEKDLANAHLIAAAPDMLELLKMLNRRGGLGYDIHEYIEKAIAKAEGGEA